MKLKVIEEETGRKVEVTVPAQTALDDIDSRIKLMKELLQCLSS